MQIEWPISGFRSRLYARFMIVGIAGGTALPAISDAAAGTHFPPPETRGDWRSLAPANRVPTAPMLTQWAPPLASSRYDGETSPHRIGTGPKEASQF